VAERRMHGLLDRDGDRRFGDIPNLNVNRIDDEHRPQRCKGGTVQSSSQTGGLDEKGRSLDQKSLTPPLTVNWTGVRSRRLHREGAGRRRIKRTCAVRELLIARGGGDTRNQQKHGCYGTHRSPFTDSRICARNSKRDAANIVVRRGA
jgi:hypothetical protein